MQQDRQFAVVGWYIIEYLPQHCTYQPIAKRSMQRLMVGKILETS